MTEIRNTQLQRLLNTCVDHQTLSMIMQISIRAELEARGLDSRGHKDELIARLIEDTMRRQEPRNDYGNEDREEQLSDASEEEFVRENEQYAMPQPIPIPQPEQGQTLETYFTQFMGVLGAVIQQNHQAQTNFQKQIVKQQTDIQRQLIQLNTERTVEIHTTPDLYTSIPIFKGKRADSVNTWINIIERIAKQQKWTPETMVSTAASRLQGEARDWQETTGYRIREWSDWKDMITLHFSRPLTMREWTSMVESRKQQSVENLTEYMRAKLKIIDSGSVPLPIKDKLDYMISGIKDITTVHMLKLQHFDDVYELIEACREIDEVNELDTRTGKNQITCKEENQNKSVFVKNQVVRDGGGFRYYRKEQKVPSEQFSDVGATVNKRTVYRKGMDKRDVTCFNCDRKGHLSFECDRPLKNKNNQRLETVPKSVHCILKSKEPTLPVVEGTLERNLKVFVLLDSGSEVSLINQKIIPSETIIRSWEGENELFILGSTYRPIGFVNLTVKIGDTEEKVRLCVVDQAPYDLLLGSDWRQQADVALTVYPNNDVKIERNDTRNKNFVIPTYYTSGCVLKVKSSHVMNNTSTTNGELEFHDIDKGLAQQIDDIVKCCDDGVSPEDREKLKIILKSNEKAFTTEGRTLGCCPDIDHKIIMINEAPVRSKPNRYSPYDKNFINQTVDEWKRKEIISDSSSDFASPVVIVEQPHHPTTPRRLCIDYRKLNENTVKVHYPIPIMEDVIEKLVANNSKVFNVLDIKTAFMTVKIRDQDKPKTAFTTQEGLYEFNRMPFGLCNAPATMQSIMNNTYKDIEGTAVYLDDIGQGASDDKKALYLLDLVLKRTIEQGLLVDLRKCQFLKRQVKMLGYIIDTNGKWPDPERTSSIDKFLPVDNEKRVRSFIQFASHYRRFIKDFSKVAKPLNDLLKKDEPFEWTQECQRSLEQLMDKVKNPPILGHFRSDCPTEVFVDASQTGLGAVLVQTQNNKKCVIEYASRSLSKTDQKLHSNSLECLAVHWAVAEKFRIYLYGSPKFTVWTDNYSVSYMATKSVINRRFARWLLDLQEYNFDVKHISGDKNGVADCLSRISHYTCAAIVVANDSRLEQEQRQDEDCRSISQVLKLEVTTKKQKKIQSEFEIRKGILLKIPDKGESSKRLIVIPKGLQRKTMELFHDKSGHMDKERTLSKMKSRYWWKTMSEDVNEYVKSCPECQKMNRRTVSTEGLLNARQPPREPYEVISIDHIGPLERSGENTHIIISVDHATRHVVAEPVTSTDTNSFLEFLRKRVILIYGTPRVIVTDCGSGFASKQAQDFFEKRGIEHVFTPPYCPSSNGLVERSVATLKAVIRKTLGASFEWPELVPEAVMAINTSIQSSLKTTPFFLIHGYTPKIEFEYFVGSVTTDDTRSEQLEKMKTTREKARQNLLRAQDSMKERFDKRHKASSFKVNDLVLYTTGTRASAMSQLYDGPYKIIKVMGENVYRISQNNQDPDYEDIKLVHAKQLRHWNQRRDIWIPSDDETTSLAEADGDELDEQSKDNHCAMPTRKRQMPAKYRDYVLNLENL